MLRLFQLVLCALGLALLVVLGLTYRIRGLTMADRICEVLNSPGCAEWVQRERLQAQGLEQNVVEASKPEARDGGPPHPTAVVRPKAPPPSTGTPGSAGAPGLPASPAATGSDSKKPLDSVTTQERQTLDKLLNVRGSK